MTTLSGVGVAIVTPFKKDFSVDYEALDRVLEYVIHGRTNYIVTLGTTGEATTLSEDEKIAILKHTLKTVNGRIPVVVGIGGNNTQEVIHKIATWPLDGVEAILSVCPYYNKPTQEGVYQHYAAIASSTNRKLLLYNVPGRTVTNITPETTFRLAAAFKNIIGTKEASGNMIQCMHLIKNRPEGFLLLSGDDHLALPLVALGFDGVISVAANCFAAEFTRLVHCALEGKFEEANHFQHKLLDGIDLLFAENNPAGVKGFLAEMGLIENILRLPLVPMSPEGMQKIRDFK